MSAVLTPGSGGRIVLSHAPADRRLAASICARLEERGVRCWLGSRDARARSAGVEARAVALEDATAILALVSAAANESADLRRELEAAFSARRPLLALLLDGTLPEGQLRYYLGESRRFQLGDDQEAVHDELAAALRRFLRVEELPRPASALVGRRRELAQIVELLHDPVTRLLTLTGPGGTGKTRLALEVARSLVPVLEDGAVWVSLAPLRDPGLALSTIAQALAVEEQPGSEPLETLAGVLAGRDLLLVLDNAEHLLPELASDVSGLFARCPRLRLLVTSRERLNVQGEHVNAVPALEVGEAIALFLRRARETGAELDASDTVSELCRRLDSLPLALELAAARSVLFTPEQLLERLGERLDLLKGARDTDPRQQTLRATIDWSYNLLTSEEQRVFRALSVFAGGCTYEAAETVTAATPDLVQSLIDKSLLRTRDTMLGRRYWMLETIREYSATRLAEEGRDGVWRSAVSYYGELLESLSTMTESASGAWRDRFELEHPNVRALLRWSLERALPAEALLLATPASSMWVQLGHLQEGREWADSALRLSADGPITAARATLARRASNLAIELGDLDRARELAEMSLATYDALGDESGRMVVLGNMAGIAFESSELEEARELLLLSLELARELEDEHSVGLATHNLGLIAEQDDPQKAVEYFEESLAVGIRLGSAQQQVHSLHSLAGAWTKLGDPHKSCALLGDALDLVLETGHEVLVPAILEDLADVAVQLGALEVGAQVLVAASELRSAHGSPPSDQEKYDELCSVLALEVDHAGHLVGSETTLEPSECVALARELAARSVPSA